ncbi:D-alanyl-D-alanine carboxypeptidase family protein [Nitrincola tapanii]|uniref:serine-type D-Ala-D-Ala carboxypeptidase n=1 Tax=Nitrincola tapanii TaxID=1708751 RepID=A0A5A9W7T5_9GAMM|nr:D-alanyl-D-alanine carboxypeptidase family protein [Nitrincola tapanii]KAA0876534.1 D-alanyl-D-alanine carboxypeptidase [Nitrincola tapanii]
MNPIRPSIYLVLLLFSLILVPLAQANNLMPSPPQLAARSYLIMDAHSGQVLVAQNEHERYPPASLVKIMTSYIAEQEIIRGNLAENDLVTISEKAWRTGGSRMFVQEGTQVSVIDLLRGIIIQSGNDASVAIAEHIAGSEEAFADLMNQHARRIGMTNTHFENATGLPSDNQYASAYDLALLARALINDSPDYYPIYAEKYFEYNKIRQPNRNRLLWRDDTVDGIKTGHTNAAGYCLVASAVRDDMRLISVVMGSASEETRAQETQQLLAYAYRFFRTHQLYQAGETLSQSRVWGGASDQVRLGVAELMAVTLPRGQEDNIEVTLDLPARIKAPLEQGQVLGRVVVNLNGEELESRDLVALEAVEPAGLLKRIWHSILQFFMGLLGK